MRGDTVHAELAVIRDRLSAVDARLAVTHNDLSPAHIEPAVTGVRLAAGWR